MEPARAPTEARDNMHTTKAQISISFRCAQEVSQLLLPPTPCHSNANYVKAGGARKLLSAPLHPLNTPVSCTQCWRDCSLPRGARNHPWDMQRPRKMCIKAGSKVHRQLAFSRGRCLCSPTEGNSPDTARTTPRYQRQVDQHIWGRSPAA